MNKEYPGFEELELVSLVNLKYFFGRMIYTMPCLIHGLDEKENKVDIERRLITPREYMHAKLYPQNKEDKDLVENNPTHTACAVIVDPRGTEETIIKLASEDSLVEKLIYSINPSSKIKSGALEITAQEYDKIKKGAIKISGKDAFTLQINGYKKIKKRQELFLYLAEGDNELVEGNYELALSQVGGNMRNTMGLWLPKQPGLYLLNLQQVLNTPGDADSWIGLNENCAGLIGVPKDYQVRKPFTLKEEKEALDLYSNRYS